MNRVPVAFEGISQRFDQERIVVNDEQPQWRGSGPGERDATRAPAGASETGKISRMSVPCPGATLDLDVRVVPLDHPVNHREPEAGAALALGGEERLEAAPPSVLIHADAGIGNLHLHRARRTFFHPAAAGFARHGCAR